MKAFINKLFLLFLLVLITQSNKSRTLENTNCESISPSIIKDCSNASTVSKSCCFYKNSGKAYCKFWDTKWVGTTTLSDGLTYHCDNYKGATCGTPNPKSAADCQNYSASTNTCCYYNQNSQSGCWWYGSGFKGKTSLNSVDIICGSNYYSFSLIILIAIFLFI